MPVSSMPPSFAPFRSTPAEGWGRRGGRRRRGRLDPQSDPLLPGPPSAVAYRAGVVAGGGRGRCGGSRRKGEAQRLEEEGGGVAIGGGGGVAAKMRRGGAQSE
uniref:Uncharacterized protein n=1 Tax=Oryza barthii TaxID=65489 RepID=A0A0D3F9C6_9ORYZ